MATRAVRWANSLTDRETRDFVRDVLRLVDPDRRDLAPTGAVFNTNAMLMAEGHGAYSVIRKLWDELGLYAHDARTLMENEDYDERNRINTN